MAEPQERSAKPSSVAGVKGCKGSANQLVLWSEDGRQGELSKCGEHCPDNIHRAARLRGCHEPPCARTALRRGPRARARGHLARGPRDRDARLRPPAGRVTAASRAERAEGFRAASRYAQVVGLVRGDPRDEGDQPSRGEHLADQRAQRGATTEPITSHAQAAEPASRAQATQPATAAAPSPTAPHTGWARRGTTAPPGQTTRLEAQPTGTKAQPPGQARRAADTTTVPATPVTTPEPPGQQKKTDEPTP